MCRPIFAVLLLTTLSTFAAEAECDYLGNCGKAHLFPMAGEIKTGRKYARDRLVDIRHLALDVTPNFTQRSIAGTVTISFSPIGQPLSKLELDAVDLNMDDVSVKDCQLTGWQNSDDLLTLNFTQPIPVGTAATVTIRYHAQPNNGLHFRTPELGYPAGDTQMWSQGEAEFHRYWFPCYDYPNERFSSEVTCHVPEGMEVVSNGKLLDKSKDAQGLFAWHWLQEKPHVNYLIGLAAGYFHKSEAAVGNVPLSLFVPPSEKDQAINAFRDTKQIMEFFQQEIGVPFPWDKYAQVYCIDFLAGGMENTSCSFMTTGALYPDSFGQLDSVHRLDAHEMAHQWFGDLITCRDWSHLWLNEGFASYYTVLYEEVKNGHEGFLLGLRKEAQRVIEANDTRPMVWRDYGEPMQQFDTRAYPKGAWVLHMLRSQLGKELYQQGIRNYIQRHRNGIVTSDDLQEVLEEVSGRSLDQFFDQWVHHGGVPELDSEFRWDEKTKMAKVTIRQKQKVDDKVPLFKLPLPIRFIHLEEGKQVAEDFSVTVSKAEEDFYFKLKQAPVLTRMDPELTILAKWTKPSHSEKIDTQLDADFLTRLIAVNSLAASNDDESVKKMIAVLSADGHYAIRAEAAKSLQAVGNDLARKGLIDNINQSDERVRFAVVETLGALYHRESRDALVKRLTEEKNPMIVQKCLASLAPWPDFDAVPFLNVASYQGMISSAAVATLGSQNRSDAGSQIMETLKRLPSQFSARDLASGLQTVGSLYRNQPNSPAQKFLVSFLSDTRSAVRSGAAKGLGELGDPASIPQLQAMAKVKQDKASAPAAEAIGKIQAQLNGQEQTQAAWKKVEALERKSAELEKKLQGLESKLKPQ